MAIAARWAAAALGLLLLASCASEGAPDPEGPREAEREDRAVAGAASALPEIANAELFADGAPRYGGVLVLANRGDPPVAFDPMRTSSIALHHAAGGVFGPGNLVTRCRALMYLVCPNLASRWVSNADFTQWTFTIRDNVSWHDGTPFTADDAKFWFELAAFGAESGGRTRLPALFKGDLGDVRKVEVLPGNRLRVTLGQRSRLYPNVLSNPRLKVGHPKHLMEQRIQQGEVNVAPLDVGVVGTGPFRLAEYERDSVVRLRRFEAYWEKDAGANRLPYLEGIDFVIMPDASAMDAALRVGRLDGGARGEGHYLTVERKAGYDADLGDGVYYATMRGGMMRLAFNVLREGPWQDVRARRAMSLWIDKGAAISSALGGMGYLGPPGPDEPFVSPDFKSYPRFAAAKLEEHRAEARRLLAEAGYSGGFSMGHLCRVRMRLRCEFLHAQLAGLGVNLELHLADEALWNRGRVSGDYDSQPGANFTAPVPEGTESVFGRSSLNPDAYAKHEDKAVDRFYVLLRRATTRDQRIQIWRDLERYLVDEQAYVIPIAGSVQVVAYRSWVRGVVVPPEDGHTHTDFATVWLGR